MVVFDEINKAVLMISQTRDFDHNPWLFETKGTYEDGNAIWPKDEGFGNVKHDQVTAPLEHVNKPRRLLMLKLKILAIVLSPYI